MFSPPLMLLLIGGYAMCLLCRNYRILGYKKLIKYISCKIISVLKASWLYLLGKYKKSSYLCSPKWSYG